MRRSIPFLVLLLAGTASCGGYQDPGRQGGARPSMSSNAAATYDVAPPAAPRLQATESSATSQGRAAAGPDINPTAAPGVAFNYNYSYALAAQRVAELQEAHAATCERMGVARCRIIGLRYQVLGQDDIQARLELKLAPADARAFGRQASEAVLQAEGMVTQTEISGVDAGSQIQQTGTDISRLQADLARLEQQLRAARDPDERIDLQNQAQRLRDQIRSLGDQRQAQQETLATTPMVLNYGSGDLVPGYRPPLSLGEALGKAWTDFKEGATVVLAALIRVAPWLITILLIGLLALWMRRRWFPKKPPVETPEPEAAPA